LVAHINFHVTLIVSDSKQKNYHLKSQSSLKLNLNKAVSAELRPNYKKNIVTEIENPNCQIVQRT
jgi:hypothetical protein